MEGSPYSPEHERSAVSRWAPRLLAPLALSVCVLAVLMVVRADESEEAPARGDRGASRQAEARPDESGPASESGSEKKPATYVVVPGDTLGSIAQTTGVPLEEIEQLNPEIDPQALPSGATLKLR